MNMNLILTAFKIAILVIFLLSVDKFIREHRAGNAAGVETGERYVK